MWVSMCVALWEVWGHKTVEGGLQYLVKKTKFASKNVPIFFCSWAQHVGVRIIFFKCALNDYFSILISIKSVLQLFLFLFFFINAGPLLTSIVLVQEMLECMFSGRAPTQQKRLRTS